MTYQRVLFTSTTMSTVENDVIKTPDILFDEKCGGLGVLLFDLCQKYKEKIALINTKNDEFYTYSDLLERCISAAKAMQNKGLQRQDVVVLCSNKENLNANVPTIAAQFLGCTSYSVGTDLSEKEYVELLEQVPPKFIFCIEDVTHKLSKVLDKLGWPQSLLVQFGPQFDQEFLCYGPDQNFKPIHVTDLKNTCIVHFSSGTTGTPKPICLNHYYFLAMKECVGSKSNTISATTQFAGCTMGPVSLRYSNWYWVSTSFELVVFIMRGGCRVMKDNFIPQEFWRDVEKYQVSDVMLTPLQAAELSNSKIPKETDISSLKKLITVGYTLHEDILLVIQKALPDVPISQVYGLTECGEVTSFDVDDHAHRKLLAAKPQSCGLPVPGLHYKVVDLESGKKCGPNQLGELYLKGKRLMNGFYNRDCSSSFDEEGFFRSGDLVYYDDNLCFYVVDRLKSVLRWKNFWLIYPYHIEQVLLSHPSVLHAVVIGIPHKIEGERVMGVVTLKEGYEHVTEKELEKFVEERVEDHKRLREGVKFVKDMPLNAAGKINKFKLKEMILNKLKMCKI